VNILLGRLRYRWHGDITADIRELGLFSCPGWNILVWKFQYVLHSQLQLFCLFLIWPHRLNNINWITTVIDECERICKDEILTHFKVDLLVELVPEVTQESVRSRQSQWLPSGTKNRIAIPVQPFKYHTL